LVTLTGARNDNTVVLIKDISVGSTVPVIDGLVLRLDANDPSSIALVENNKVTQWRDKFGRNNHLNAVSGQQPKYVAGVYNGTPAVRFDATGEKTFTYTSK